MRRVALPSPHPPAVPRASGPIPLARSRACRYAENCHVTMLLDAGDESLLRLQLYQAAEAPAPDVLKVFVAEDRSTWTLSNLQRLSISELARLQRYAGPTYSSALRLPINLLKLGGCTNNMAPFSAYLFPTDKFDLTHSNHGRVQFKLDAKVFESGTAKNSRAALQVRTIGVVGMASLVSIVSLVQHGAALQALARPHCCTAALLHCCTNCTNCTHWTNWTNCTNCTTIRTNCYGSADSAVSMACAD